jgi:hypothetical protein
MLKLAQLMSLQEGFGVPGAIPTIRNNPLDLRHSNHSSHDGIAPNAIGIIDTVEHGWEDGERQIRLVAEHHPDITLTEFIAGQRDAAGNVLPGGYPGWAPRADGNDPPVYVARLALGLRCGPRAPLAALLEIEA